MESWIDVDAVILVMGIAIVALGIWLGLNCPK